MVLAGALGSHHAITKASAAPDPATGAPGPAAASAIAFAQKQIGDPYLYGATGPDYWDCSGLTQAAYAAAGISIPRTSEQQWAAMTPVSAPQPGDLVFFTGSPIDSPPGHVGIVVDPARHLMIDAYASGVPVREETYGLPSSAPGLSAPWGYREAE
jgi:cell wall-associated NlpC family hydrolase